MLAVQYTSRFERDVKALLKRHVDLAPLKDILRLIAADADSSKAILRQRHNMHALKGKWAGSHECHAANAGNWLVIWKTGNGVAVFQRTCIHDELFR